MKLLKTLAASSLALGFIGTAWAQTDVYVAGSTAFRSAVVTAEINLLGGASAVATAESDTKAVGSTTISAVSGTDGSGNPIIFHNHWTGSVAGVVDISNGNSLSQIPDSALGAAGSNTQNAPTTASAVPQVAMSDNVYTDAQTVLANANTTGKNFGKNVTGLLDGGTAAGANGGPVAIVTFQWMLGAISAGSTVPAFTNLTQDQAAALVSTGSIPLSLITGNQADAGNFVLFVGRNEDSGSRVFYQGESAKVVSGSATQWMLEQSTTPGGTAISTGYPTASSGAGYPSIVNQGGITAVKKWPGSWTLNTETAVTWTTPGHSGYNGGGDVAAVLASPNPVSNLTFTNSADATSLGSAYNAATSNIYFVTCIGSHDGAALTGGTLLTYNGVGISDANIQNGIYPLWNYEHLYYTSALTGTAKTAADELADTIYNLTETQFGGSPAAGSPGLPVSSMNVTRGLSAGAVIK